MIHPASDKLYQVTSCLQLWFDKLKPIGYLKNVQVRKHVLPKFPASPWKENREQNKTLAIS